MQYTTIAIKNYTLPLKSVSKLLIDRRSLEKECPMSNPKKLNTKV